eukprot:Phypoly_transcript_17674.p1 GENE.Phypoly_transcript_17674~~Phypoly_transcript_17674.p1  ORF type:complete len:182 (+),score=31.48 Phypoly_transcript_17674:198-743(+)
MGANTSTLRTEEITEMQAVSHFSPKEIKRLYKRFKRLDKDEKGSISTDEFLTIPELSMNPLVSRIISMFDNKKDGQVNFRQFVETMSVFHPKGNREEKLNFLFKVYDINNDGVITADEIFAILKMLVGTNLTDEQINVVVRDTMLEADQSGTGKLSFEDFRDKMKPVDIVPKLSIAFIDYD